jgi:hypothetical protein
MKRLIIVALSLGLSLLGGRGIAAQESTSSHSESVTTTHNGQSETTARSTIVQNGETVSDCDYVGSSDTGSSDVTVTSDSSDAGGRCEIVHNGETVSRDAGTSAAPAADPGLDPATAAADTDGDYVADGDERARYGTDPAVADTDGDGLWDGQELFGTATDPLRWDTNGDGVGDGASAIP